MCFHTDGKVYNWSKHIIVSYNFIDVDWYRFLLFGIQYKTRYATLQEGGHLCIYFFVICEAKYLNYQVVKFYVTFFWKQLKKCFEIQLIVFPLILFLWHEIYISFFLLSELIGYVIVSIFIFGLSPVLKTLMKSISTDTIYAMTVSFFICFQFLTIIFKIQFNIDYLKIP